MSQEVAARDLRISLSMLKKYESGRNLPGAEALAAIHRAGCDVGWLLTGAGAMNIRAARDLESENLLQKACADPALEWFLSTSGPTQTLMQRQLNAFSQLAPELLREALDAVLPSWMATARNARVQHLERRLDDLSAEVKELSAALTRVEQLLGDQGRKTT